MKKEVRLYNVLFPLWMAMLLLPKTWLIVLPGNFIIDSAVLVIAMYALRLDEKKLLYKRSILKIFVFGLLADIIGSAYMLLMMIVFDVGAMGDEIYLALPALVISAAMIFVFNYFITFRNTDVCRLKLAIIFAVFTAPYTFLIPISWIYN